MALTEADTISLLGCALMLREISTAGAGRRPDPSRFTGSPEDISADGADHDGTDTACGYTPCCDWSSCSRDHVVAKVV